MSLKKKGQHSLKNYQGRTQLIAGVLQRNSGLHQFNYCLFVAIAYSISYRFGMIARMVERGQLHYCRVHGGERPATVECMEERGQLQ
jgi:hypothetical protein